ncbi:MAG: AraC family transcriptional regulator [Hespellia sp.]|nr:AraC family transcriptional regulator [Hespellia sp.]
MNTIDFVRKTIAGFGIHTFIINEPFQWDSVYDNALREHILTSQDEIEEQWPVTIPDICQRSILATISDDFNCEYVCMRLPDSDRLSVLFVGPFTYEKMTISRTLELCNKASLPANLNSFMHQYYQSLPFLADDRLIRTLLQNLAEDLWPDSEIKVNSYTEKRSIQYYYNTEHPSASKETIKELEDRYQNERNLMTAISTGNLTAVNEIITNDGMPALKQRFSDALHDMKNYMIIFNTICRKSAELGHVHPVYLDEISRKYAFEIERTTSIKQLYPLYKNMLHKYCLLVQSHSLKGYSQPIQQAINYISFNLTEDLRLSSVAKTLLLNSSYLSTLFKKETGMTLTHFANQKRIEQALFLLNTTTLSIQDIAIQCGIDDLSYFTKTFKKYQNMSPSAYRDMISSKPPKTLTSDE